MKLKGRLLHINFYGITLETALDEARDMQGIDIVENAGGQNGMIMMGGVVLLPAGKAAIISNSSTDYAGGIKGGVENEANMIGATICII